MAARPALELPALLALKATTYPLLPVLAVLYALPTAKYAIALADVKNASPAIRLSLF